MPDGRALARSDLEAEAPPDAELIADAVEALEERRLPDEFAIEELVHLARGRALVEGKLRRRRALRVVAEVQAANPGASMRAVTAIAARRLGERPETVRGWARGLDSTHEARDGEPLRKPEQEP